MPRIDCPLVRSEGSKGPTLLARFVVVFALAALGAAATAAEPESSEASQLRRYDISPNAVGVANFLTNLYPSPELQKRIDRLISELGSEDFSVREAASRTLSGVGAARPALTKAIHNPDAEISHRARRILEATAGEQERLLLTVLRTIAKEKLPGAAEPLIRAMPLCQKEYLRRAAAAALAATVRPVDAPLLRKAIATGNRQLRTAAIVALERAVGPASVETLRPYLKAADDATRLSAAEALVSRLPRESLDTLVSLLESDRAAVRIRSGHDLRQLTGQQFGYVGGSDDLAARSAAVARWRQWVDGTGRTATLHVPLPDMPLSLGRTIVCVYDNGGLGLPGGRGAALVEVDDHGHIKEMPDAAGRIQMPFGCQGLPDGHWLVADLPSSTVSEVDAQGKTVWHAKLAGGPASVDRLENGNTLVSLYQAKRVVEVNPEGKTVWRAEVSGMPSDAHGLENGNVLVVVSDQGRVMELDRAGKTVWKLEGVSHPWSARRLPDGNTLVSCYGVGKVVEYAPNGSVAWTHNGVPNCFDAVALENGHVLIGYVQGLLEVNRQGTTIKERSIGMVRRISVY